MVYIPILKPGGVINIASPTSAGYKPVTPGYKPSVVPGTTTYQSIFGNTPEQVRALIENKKIQEEYLATTLDEERKRIEELTSFKGLAKGVFSDITGGVFENLFPSTQEWKTNWKGILKETFKPSAIKEAAGIVGGATAEVLSDVMFAIGSIPFKAASQVGIPLPEKVENPVHTLLDAIGKPEWSKHFNDVSLMSWTDKAKERVDQGMDWKLASLLTGSEAILDVAIIGGIAQGAISRYAAPAKVTTVQISKAAKHLKVNVKATPAQIKQAYYKQAHITHPDMVTGSKAAFQKTAAAYKTLTGVKPVPFSFRNIAEMLTRQRVAPWVSKVTTPGVYKPIVQPALPEGRLALPAKAGVPAVIPMGKATIPAGKAIAPVAPLAINKSVQELMKLGYKQMEAEAIIRDLSTRVTPTTPAPAAAVTPPITTPTITAKPAVIVPTTPQPLAKEARKGIFNIPTEKLSGFKTGGGTRTAKQIAELKESIKMGGIKQPVAFIKKIDGTFRIDSGTHRIAIANELGIKNVPTEFYQIQKGGGSIKLTGKKHNKH